MRIALIKESKIPEDNRVALSPNQVAELNKKYPQHQIVVQSSNIRAFSDEEYRKQGVSVVDDVSDCDVFLGIKEAKLESLIPDKQYFFFGHFAKMQEYNRPLLQTLMRKRISFYDYEYLVDDNNNRVCAFGWWAGVVGVYYTLRGYGIKYHLYELPKPDYRFTLEQLLDSLKSIELPQVRLLITGTGRVSHGAQFVLDVIGAKELDEGAFLSETSAPSLSYCVVPHGRMVKRKDNKPYFLEDFVLNMSEYESDFLRWARKTDILICGHYWDPHAPVYLTEEDFLRDDLHISMIGDVTCDIMGSVKSTVRSTTHEAPFFDYNPVTRREEPAFTSNKNILVMAVDTCPNALAMDTSEYFGSMLIKHVIEPLLNGEPSEVIHRSMILEKGRLTPRFEYLEDFAKK